MQYNYLFSSNVPMQQPFNGQYMLVQIVRTRFSLNLLT